MAKIKKHLITILLILFGSCFTYKLYQTYQADLFLDGIILFTIASVGLLIFLRTIITDRKNFNTDKSLTSYIPTSIGIFFILINIGLFYYLDNKKNSPSLIRGFNDGGFNGFLVDFKTDGNYVMANGSGIGQTYFYGKYTINDSIITIDKNEIDNCIKSNKLIIRTENYFPKDSIDLLKSKANYITQIDKNGKEINNEFRFRITDDNRKK